MEITRKGKILRIYGRNLADEFEKKENIMNHNFDLSFMLLREMYNQVNSKLNEVRKDFKQNESQKITNYFAESLFEKGHLNFAYHIYKEMGSKNAEVMEETFPKQMLELIVISGDNRIFPLVKEEKE